MAPRSVRRCSRMSTRSRFRADLSWHDTVWAQPPPRRPQWRRRHWCCRQAHLWRTKRKSGGGGGGRRTWVSWNEKMQNNEQLQLADSSGLSISYIYIHYILYLYCKHWADSWEVDSGQRTLDIQRRKLTALIFNLSQAAGVTWWGEGKIRPKMFSH